MNSQYNDNWDDFIGMMQDFQEDPDRWKDINVLFAKYSYGCYEGDAFVLFEQNGKLYEVNGGHCSCYGLEGQWDPEPTSVEAVRHRIEHGTLGLYEDDDNFVNELKATLDKLENA